jgi:hypothetical protein
LTQFDRKDGMIVDSQFFRNGVDGRAFPGARVQDRALGRIVRLQVPEEQLHAPFREREEIKARLRLWPGHFFVSPVALEVVW